MAVAIDKARVWQALLSRVEDDLAQATSTQKRTQAGATHEEARAENDKDTRALEATYLARGLAERVATLEQARARLGAMAVRDFGPDDPIALGALVTLLDADSGTESHFLITPMAGGLTLPADGAEVVTVTTQAPIGRALIGSFEGDDARIRTPQGLRELEIVAVR